MSNSIRLGKKKWGKTIVRCSWLLSSFLSMMLLGSPAQAAKLLSWRFDVQSSQLSFTTDSGVQPKAQLLFNPTRIVIDLPGVTIDSPIDDQSIGGAIRDIRIGQFEPQIARLVIEYNPGYAVDPQQVKFQGISTREWQVRLPTFSGSPNQSNPVTLTPTQTTTPVPPNPDLPPSQSPSLPPDTPNQLQNLQTTEDGFFIRTLGQTPEIVSFRSRDRQSIIFDIRGTVLAPTIQSQEFFVNRHGVTRIEFKQVQTSSPVARIILDVAPNSPDWQASFSSLGGIVLLPQTGTGSLNPQPNQNPISTGLTTIQSVDLIANGTQLVIQGNQPLLYTSGWEPGHGTYRIVIAHAQLGEGIRKLQTNVSGNLLSLRLGQEDPQNVVILMQPATGVQIRPLDQPNHQSIFFQLQRLSLVPPELSPDQNRPPVENNPLNPPIKPHNGRLVVIIDPGHGGNDPGAVGIGGLREKDIVLDIGKQVTTLLEQQGVQAILTRQDDQEIDLEPRVQLAERVNATIFVSIHANAIDLSRPDISGLETYYYASGDRLAATVHRSILQSIDIPDRHIRQANFYVLRRTSMPAILVEVGFVTGRDDAEHLSNPAYRTRMAEAIARGILQYLR